MLRDHKLVMLDDDHHSSDPRLDLHVDSPHFCLPIRRRKFVVGFVLSALSLLVPAYLYFSQFPLLETPDAIFGSHGASTWNRTSALLGPPTDHFRGSSALPYNTLLPINHMLTQITYVTIQNTSHHGFLLDGVGVSSSLVSGSFTYALDPANDVMTYVCPVSLPSFSS